MKTVNSISGGKTSSYIAKHYPADYNVFALVTTDDKRCLYPDQKIRQKISDKIGKEFIGTLEDDTIIKTMFELEQFIGTEITWVAGQSFDKVIQRGKKKYLPNVTQRFCTTDMKLKPIFKWWQKNINTPIEMRIGYRANEQNRAKVMLSKTNKDGLSELHTIIGKSKNGKRNKWAFIPWQKPVFPLINDGMFKDNIEEYWKNKPVTFAFMNNCIGCFHRNEVLLKHMSERHPNKYNWFEEAEQEKGYNIRTFKNGVTYKQIRNSLKQTTLFDSDFNECDSGYCGL